MQAAAEAAGITCKVIVGLEGLSFNEEDRVQDAGECVGRGGSMVGMCRTGGHVQDLGGAWLNGWDGGLCASLLMFVV